MRVFRDAIKLFSAVRQFMTTIIKKKSSRDMTVLPREGRVNYEKLLRLCRVLAVGL